MKILLTMSLLLGVAPFQLLFAQDAGDENPLQLKAHHASLSVDDLDRAQDFYQNVLGFKPGNVRKGANGETRQVVIPGFAINLTRRNGSVRNTKAEGSLEQGWIHIVLETPILDEVRARLDEQNVPTRPALNGDGELSRLLVFDPEGNQIELIRPR